jgi:hypothetical protein
MNHRYYQVQSCRYFSLRQTMAVSCSSRSFRTRQDILTSATVDEGKGNDSRPASPVKIDFDMSPYQVALAEENRTFVTTPTRMLVII